MKVNELREKLQEKNERLSRAKRVRSLLQKQKGLLKAKQSLTDFDEPVLFLARRDGKIDTYEKATSGKHVFEHSSGNARFITLRPSDQRTMDYADKKVRCYIAHEDRPFADWEEPVVDSETVMLGYEKTKATDLKYQQALERLKIKGRYTWVWIAVGIAGAIVIFFFGFNTWGQPALSRWAAEKAQAEVIARGTPPVVPILLPLWWKAKELYRRKTTKVQ